MDGLKCTNDLEITRHTSICCIARQVHDEYKDTKQEAMRGRHNHNMILSMAIQPLRTI